MKKFDYTFLKINGIPSSVLSLFVTVEKLQGKGYKYKELYPQVFEKIQKIANIQSVKFSNKIDGVTITELKLESLFDKLTYPLNYLEEQISSYRDILLDIDKNHDSYQFNEYILKDFNQNLFPQGTGGYLREDEEILMETLEDGTKRILSNTIIPNDISKAMEDIVEAYKIARNDDDIPKLLLIPCVILDFLLIYPFNDGNERISRLLSLLLLYKNDYNVGKYVSFEKQIYKYKTNYYESIRLSSINWNENTNDYNPFIVNFLKSLYYSYNELYSRFNIIDGEKKSKKIRIEETIKKSFEPISRKEIHLVWPDISHETIKKVIKNLLNENKIKKIGSFKDARYKRNWYGKPTQSDENMVIF